MFEGTKIGAEAGLEEGEEAGGRIGGRFENGDAELVKVGKKGEGMML